MKELQRRGESATSTARFYHHQKFTKRLHLTYFSESKVYFLEFPMKLLLLKSDK